METNDVFKSYECYSIIDGLWRDLLCSGTLDECIFASSLVPDSIIIGVL